MGQYLIIRLDLGDYLEYHVGENRISLVFFCIGSC